MAELAAKKADAEMAATAAADLAAGPPNAPHRNDLRPPRTPLLRHEGSGDRCRGPLPDAPCQQEPRRVGDLDERVAVGRAVGEVRAELAEAIRTGQLLAPGESGLTQ